MQKLKLRLQSKYSEKQRICNLLRRETIFNQIQKTDDSGEHDILILRRNVKQQLQERSLSKSLLIRQKVQNINHFLSERSETPKYICVCCEGLFFHYSVVLATQNELKELAPNNSMYTTKYICSTCRRQWKNKPNKLPTLAVKNGLEYPVIPECLKNLSQLEERFISPYVNFMQIQDLTPYALNSQLGIKGSVVNIPVNVPEMIDVLPRSFNDLMTILVEFKRRLEHTSNYMFATVRPKFVHEGLIYIIQKELYRSYNITIHHDLMNIYLQSKEEMDFIIDPSDKDVLENVTKKSLPDPTVDSDSDLSDDENSNEQGLNLRSKRRIEFFIE